MTTSNLPRFLRRLSPEKKKETSLNLQVAKRVIDLSVFGILLPLLLVVVPVISLLIVLESPGPPIFVQERIGYRGKRFRIYKFRTLVRNRSDQAERAYMKEFITGRTNPASNMVHKPIPHHHITRLGRFLRKSSLDELPQIFNVFKGEMSLIGPRPNVPWEVESYKPWHYERLQVLPGITGMAQVMGRSSLSFDQIVQYDIQYVRYQSLRLDLWIVWETFKTVFTGRGAG